MQAPLRTHWKVKLAPQLVQPGSAGLPKLACHRQPFPETSVYLLLVLVESWSCVQDTLLPRSGRYHLECLAVLLLKTLPAKCQLYRVHRPAPLEHFV
jgi:hypothetical protein